MPNMGAKELRERWRATPNGFGLLPLMLNRGAGLHATAAQRDDWRELLDADLDPMRADIDRAWVTADTWQDILELNTTWLSNIVPLRSICRPIQPRHTEDEFSHANPDPDGRHLSEMTCLTMINRLGLLTLESQTQRLRVPSEAEIQSLAFVPLRKPSLQFLCPTQNSALSVPGRPGYLIPMLDAIRRRGLHFYADFYFPDHRRPLFEGRPFPMTNLPPGCIDERTGLPSIAAAPRLWLSGDEPGESAASERERYKLADIGPIRYRMIDAVHPVIVMVVSGLGGGLPYDHSGEVVDTMIDILAEVGLEKLF